MNIELDDIWVDTIKRLNNIRPQDKRRLYRIAMVGTVGASYLLDTILLTLFVLTGTIQTIAPVCIGLAGLGHVVLFSTLHWTGFSEQFKNCHMTIWQMTYGIGVQMIGILLAPQITPYFLAIIFVIFAYGTLRISFREALLAWLFACIAIALTIHFKNDVRLTLPSPSTMEYLLVSVSFSLILFRAIVLGYYASVLRQRIYDISRIFQNDALHDELTGIHNRRALIDILADQFSLYMRKGIPCCFAMIDIDHFKRINDNFGHAMGDEILKTFAKKLSDRIRESDKLVRYGGEEFLLIMAATRLDEAERMAQRLRKEITQTQWNALPDGYTITVSIGLTELMQHDHANDTLTRADNALYEAKGGGRNRVVIYSYKPSSDAEKVS
ncbi:MAG: GGDEF domain-containing protein [Candidatus Thiodiazotropha sp.]|jgi:diguanylate cyclase (GGDEF)-like protein